MIPLVDFGNKIVIGSVQGIRLRIKGEGCISGCPFSLEGEGWDEGGITSSFILLSPSLSGRRGGAVLLP